MIVLGTNVLLKLNDSTTKAGIIIPDTVDNKGPKIQVEAVGEECKIVKNGDFVLVDPLSLPLITYEINGQKYYRINEYQIIAILSEKDEVNFYTSVRGENEH